MRPSGIRSVVAGLLLAAPLFVSVALADGAEDGNSGLQALNQGDYDGAISYFSRAIQYGQLAPADQEFAYANRGRAYLQKGDSSSAIVDLDAARRMKPDDADAQNDLLTALQAEIPPDSIPGRPKPGIWDALGHALLNGLANGVANATQQQQQQ